MARHVFPLVLVVVALVVRIILAAPSVASGDTSNEINSIRTSDEDINVEEAIFNSFGVRPCQRRCYRRDHTGECRLNFSCFLGLD
ncbi:uncharacterized protein LOC134764862 [Penaeus indicus]|uniref:uncharacterized protein LOC134764862 n=1 Tax=Penaeus indicus TaxID=29960 RepID=UPI00300C8205